MLGDGASPLHRPSDGSSESKQLALSLEQKEMIKKKGFGPLGSSLCTFVNSHPICLWRVTQAISSCQKKQTNFFITSQSIYMNYRDKRACNSQISQMILYILWKLLITSYFLSFRFWSLFEPVHSYEKEQSLTPNQSKITLISHLLVDFNYWSQTTSRTWAGKKRPRGPHPMADGTKRLKVWRDKMVKGAKCRDPCWGRQTGPWTENSAVLKEVHGVNICKKALGMGRLPVPRVLKVTFSTVLKLSYRSLQTKSFGGFLRGFPVIFCFSRCYGA